MYRKFLLIIAAIVGSRSLPLARLPLVVAAAAVLAAAAAAVLSAVVGAALSAVVAAALSAAASVAPASVAARGEVAEALAEALAGDTPPWAWGWVSVWPAPATTTVAIPATVTAMATRLLAARCRVRPLWADRSPDLGL